MSVTLAQQLPNLHQRLPAPMRTFGNSPVIQVEATAADLSRSLPPQAIPPSQQKDMYNQSCQQFNSELDMGSACTPASNASWDAGSVEDLAQDTAKT